MVQIIPLLLEHKETCFLPDVGSFHSHCGGNIWQVTRIGYVYVYINMDDGRIHSVNKGLCIFLKCHSWEGISKEDCPWPIHQFNQDFCLITKR
jgi:hypothetical protein